MESSKNADSWRLLDLGLVDDPYEGESIKEVLITALKRNLIPNTLCFYVLPKHIWVGRRANLEKRVNLEYCRRERIPIIRGIMEGGAGTHDGDVLECNLVSRGRADKNDIRLPMNFIPLGLQAMGLEPDQRPRSNDVLVKGQKISGTGTLFLPGGPFISVGVIPLDFNYDLCEKTLLPIPESFVNKEAKSHREWMTTLKTQLGREAAFSEVIFAIKHVFETELQIEFELADSFTEAEKKISEDLREKYRSEEWLRTGRWSPVKDYGR